MSIDGFSWLRGARKGDPELASKPSPGLHPLVAFSIFAAPPGRYGALKLELAADMSLAPTFTVQPMLTATGARELAGALLALADRLEAPEQAS
jgi:hypothetical protein